MQSTAITDQEIPANEWTHISGQFKTKSALPAFNLTACIHHESASAVNSVHIFKNLKLEKGNKSTDWSPAPEDIEARVNERGGAEDRAGRNCIHRHQLGEL